MIFKAILLGIIEGLTELLPISSTGHLIVAENAMSYHDAGKLFAVVVQMGAMLAVMWHFRHDFLARVKGLLAGNKGAKTFWVNLFVATLPAGLVGLLFNTMFENLAVPSTVALALIVGGGIIFWAEARFAHALRDRQVKLDDITPRQALQIGLAQVVALIPGVSRSGATIIGGMAAGLNRATAVSFSFYLSLPVLGLAGLYKIVKNHEDFATLPGGVTAMIFGVAAAFVTSTIVINWLLKYVAHNDFRPFAYYRIYFGVFILVLILLNVVPNTN